MTHQCFSNGSPFEQQIGYSRAVVDDDYIFISGTTGFNYDTMIISEDVVEQAEQCFKNIEKTLIQTGANLDHIVRIHYILPNKKDFPLCWHVCKKHLKNAKPAATFFQAGLLDDAMKIEIEVTAKRPSKSL